MIMLSEDEKYIKYEKCRSCGSEKNTKALIIENDLTKQKSIIVLCDDCLKNIVVNKK